MFTQTMQAIRSCMYNYFNQSTYGKETRYVYSNHASHKTLYVPSNVLLIAVLFEEWDTPTLDTYIV